MPDLQAVGFDVVVILAFLFVVWYIGGALWQRSVRASYVRSLGAAITALSRSHALPRIRWLGLSGFQLVLDDPVEPFTKVAVLTILAPREVLGLYLWTLVRRGGDSVVVRADLRRRPHAAREAEPDGEGVRRISVSNSSPHLIATLDPGWVRGRDPEGVAAAIARAGALAAQVT